jgi:hypothetical protein
MERRVIGESLGDASVRQSLLADPGAALEEELGTRLPDSVKVRALEESAEAIYLVLPPGRSGDVQADELSDLELETVAGGWKPGGTSSVCGDPHCSDNCAL